MNTYKMDGIFNRIKTEVNDFQEKSIQITPHYKYNQKQTLEDIIRLYNSRFEKGEYDSQGFRKYFFNIVKGPCYTSAKAIDFDTKDIMILPVGGQNSIWSWLMEKDLRHWMKESGFGRTLNDIFFNVSVYGSVVLKKAKDNLHIVDLRNFIVEQSADSLKSAAYIIEQHRYTPYELRQTGWNNVEEVITAWRETKEPYIRIVERYGELTEEEISDGSPSEHKFMRTIAFIPEGRDVTQSDLERWNIGSGGVILEQEEVDSIPYREIHWEKMPGRWLGMGRVEILSDPQMRINELVNLRVKSSYFSTLNLYFSRDDNVKKNLLQDLSNGDVITAMDRIERVPTEDRALSSIDLEERKWSGIRDEITLTHDVVRGERPPAGTPLGSTQIATSMTMSYFEGIKENIAMAIKDIIYEDVIPMFKKQGEHYLKLVGEDLEKWNRLIAISKTNEEVFKFIKKNNKIPSKDQYDIMKETITEKVKKKKEDILVPKNAYKDIKYKVDIVITGESKNIQVQTANNSMILQMLQQDPEVLTNPGKRRIFTKILESMGMQIEDLDGGGVDKQEMMAQKVGQVKGGGISRPPNIPQGAQAVGGNMQV
jgi:hypothetical protein